MVKDSIFNIEKLERFNCSKCNFEYFAQEKNDKKCDFCNCKKISLNNSYIFLDDAYFNLVKFTNNGSVICLKYNQFKKDFLINSFNFDEISSLLEFYLYIFFIHNNSLFTDLPYFELKNRLIELVTFIRILRPSCGLFKIYQFQIKLLKNLLKNT